MGEKRGACQELQADFRVRFRIRVRRFSQVKGHAFGFTRRIDALFGKADADFTASFYSSRRRQAMPVFFCLRFELFISVNGYCAFSGAMLNFFFEQQHFLWNELKSLEDAVVQSGFDVG